MVIGIVRVENGLVKYRDTWRGGPAAFFADVTEETYVIKHGLFIFQTVLVDGVMVRSYFDFCLKSCGLIGVPCLAKDLSLLCSLAIRPGGHHTNFAVV
jgi:hypothetical protein